MVPAVPDAGAGTGNLRAREMELVHHFSIQVSKYLFYSPDLGFLQAASPLRMDDATAFGLRPVLLYAIEVERLPRRFVQLCFIDKPLDPVAFLLDGWRSIDPLMGMPDLVKIHVSITRRVPELFDVIRSLGSRSEVGSSMDKFFTGRLQYVQDDAKWFMDDSFTSPLHDPAILNAFLREKVILLSDYRTSKAKHRELMVALDARKRVPAPASNPPAIVGVLDALSEGAQNGAFGIGQISIWERAESFVGFPDRPGHLPYILDEGEKPDTVHAVRLKRGKAEERSAFDVTPADESERSPYEDDSDDDLVDDTDDYVIHELRMIVPMAKSWPNGSSALLRAIDMKVKDFDRIVRMERDPKGALRRVIAELGLMYVEDASLEPYRPTISFPPTRAIAGKVYEELTHGDADLSGELMPESGVADPSFRYHLFVHGFATPHVMVFARGSDAAVALDDRSLKFDGGFPSLEAPFYRAVVELSGLYFADPLRCSGHLDAWWGLRHGDLMRLMDRWPRWSGMRLRGG